MERKPTFLADVNKRLTQAYKYCKTMDIDVEYGDMSVILGKQQVEDLKQMTWCGAKKDENGLTTLASICPIIECNMDSVLEVCLVIPR